MVEKSHFRRKRFFPHATITNPKQNTRHFTCMLGNVHLIGKLLDERKVKILLVNSKL